MAFRFLYRVKDHDGRVAVEEKACMVSPQLWVFDAGVLQNQRPAWQRQVSCVFRVACFSFGRTTKQLRFSFG